MIQKIIQIGNSTGLIVPKSVLDVLGLEIGSEVKIDTDTATKSLIIQNKKSEMKNSSINPHFLKIVDRVNNQYGTALRELAQK